MTAAEVVAWSDAVVHICVNGAFVLLLAGGLAVLAAMGLGIVTSMRDEARHNEYLRRRMRGER